MKRKDYGVIADTKIFTTANTTTTTTSKHKSSLTRRFRRRFEWCRWWLVLFLAPVVSIVIVLPFVVVVVKERHHCSTVVHCLHQKHSGKRTTVVSATAATTTTTTSMIAHNLQHQPPPLPPPKQSSGVSGGDCAICFFGLPRSFELLVLPSIIQNVLIPNSKYRCDIYLHYYDIVGEVEKHGRSGGDGALDTRQVWLLQEAMHKVYQGHDDRHENNEHGVHLSFVNDTNATFWTQRGKQVEKYMTTKGSDGSLLYYPWMAKSFDKTSVHNLIKQWHSISRVWEEMERNARLLGKNYTRVAMLRNDVMFVTPFDLYQISNTTRDTENRMVAVPNWARFPINDRMVYGPYDAIKIWATERFQRLETHVRTYNEPGYGLHSERFLNHSIFPPIRDLGYTVVPNPEICFFRARADGSVWINDCATRDGAALGFRNINKAQTLVEALVGHKCVRSKFKQRVVQVQCNNAIHDGAKTDS